MSLQQLLAGLAPFLLCSCAAIQRPQATYDGMKLKAATAEGITLEFTYQVHNPGWAKVRLAGYKAQLSLDGVPFVVTHGAQSVEIARGQQVRYPVTANLPFARIHRMLGSLIRRSDVRCRLQGDLLFDAFLIGPVRIPVEAVDRVPIATYARRALPEAKRRAYGLQ